MDKTDDGYELGAAVITPKGYFPDDENYRRAYSNQTIQSLLDMVKEKQELTNTEGWVLVENERLIDPSKTFGEEGLKCIIDMEWHKAEGGGGS